MEPGQFQGADYEDKCHGTCNLFLFFQLRRGWRAVHVTEPWTNEALTQQMPWLVDAAFPEAKVIRSVYQAFPPEEARRMTTRSPPGRSPATKRAGRWCGTSPPTLGIKLRRLYPVVKEQNLT